MFQMIQVIQWNQQLFGMAKALEEQLAWFARSSGSWYNAAMPLPIDRIERLITLDPNDATLHFALGQAYLEAGRFADAVSALERAIALTPRYTAAGISFGQTSFQGRSCS